MTKETKNREIQQQIEQDQTEEKIARTEVYLHCRGHAAIALNKLQRGGFDGAAILDRLDKSIDRILDNNLNEIEAMLITQAKSLEYVFYDALTKLPNSNIEHAEVFANIAFRAQTGCRKTLMALAELKHPRRTTTIIKQQNNALTQQVNNNVKSQSRLIEKNKKIANELNAEVAHETKTVDIGSAITTSATHNSTETVEILDRPKNPRRQKHFSEK